MNAEITMGSSLAFERPPRHREYNNRFSQVRPMVGVSLKPHFTPRQTDVMRELVRGDGGDHNKEIGFRLGLTEGTVKVYLHRLQRQLNLNSRTALALYVERSEMFYECAGEFEPASKVKSWMLTRLLTGEGRADMEETDKHLFDPSGH